jgi:hypothetical protein
MPRTYSPYIPQSKNELMDHLAFLMLSSPTFVDESGYFPGRNVDTAFFALNEGLRLIRNRLGEEKYEALVSLSARMRAHFEADPEDETGETQKGRELIHEMEDLLMGRTALVT